MKIKLNVQSVFATFMIVMLTACTEKVPQLPLLSADDVVVAFGDSLTYGTGADAEESYPAVLAELIGRKVVRAGVPGEITAQGLARLPSVIEAHDPRLMIVCLGGNDLLRKKSEAETEENLRAIITDIRRRDIDVVLIGVPKASLIGGTARFYSNLAAEFGIPYEGKILKDVLYNSEYKSDTIHPNAKGYRKMAEAIAELLKKSGMVAPRDL